MSNLRLLIGATKLLRKIAHIFSILFKIFDRHIKYYKNMKQDLLNFILWMFKEENKDFVNNGSSVKIAQLYNKETGSNVNHAFVLYHRFKWVLINGEPFEIDKIPKFLLVDKQFKDFAKKRGIIIETMKDESEIIAEYSNEAIKDSFETIEDHPEPFLLASPMIIDPKPFLLSSPMITEPEPIVDRILPNDTI